MKEHPLLCAYVAYKKKTVLNRLVEELKIKQLSLTDEYKVLSSKFQCIATHLAFNYRSYKINTKTYQINEKKLMNCQYKIVVYDNDDNKKGEKNCDISLRFDDEFTMKIPNKNKYKIYIKNRQLFDHDNYILIQEINPKSDNNDKIMFMNDFCKIYILKMKI